MDKLLNEILDELKNVTVMDFCNPTNLTELMTKIWCFKNGYEFESYLGYLSLESAQLTLRFGEKADEPDYDIDELGGDNYHNHWGGPSNLERSNSPYVLIKGGRWDYVPESTHSYFASRDKLISVRPPNWTYMGTWHRCIESDKITFSGKLVNVRSPDPHDVEVIESLYTYPTETLAELELALRAIDFVRKKKQNKV